MPQTRAASFVFEGPSVFEADNALGEITGLYMVDEEGELASVDVNAVFVNGKPSKIECKYVSLYTSLGCGQSP